MYSYKEIYPRHTSYCRFPKSLDQGLNSIFCMHYQHEFPPAFVAALPGGEVWGLDGNVMMHNGRLLGNAFTGYQPPSAAENFTSDRNLIDADYIDSSVAVLVTPYSNSYYHWMFDVVPRLHLLNQSGITCDRYLINWDGLSFQSETLALLGIPETKLIKNNSSLHLKARLLIIPSLSTHAGYMPGWACTFLRNELLTAAASGLPIEEYRRIYISRADSAYRHVTNEQELITFLKDFGFKAVLPGTLSFTEQASAFSSADVVIAPHGAGLANLVFCNPQTKIIEFFSPNYVRHHYWWISNYLNLDYYYFEGLGERPPRNTNANARTQDIDVSLEPADLIGFYRKFIRIKDPILKGNASNITDWQHLCNAEGWLSQPVAVALQWLVRQLPLRATALELGASTSRASKVIAAALPPGGLLYHINHSGNMNRNNPKVLALDGNSQINKLVREIPAVQDVTEFFDMVFVNTKFDYHSVRQTIIDLYPKLKTGGYMVFHNYGWLPGVKQAVLSLGLEGYYIADGLWCHRKTAVDGALRG